MTTAPSSFKLGDKCIDDDRPMKVVVIGAGFSGIIAGIRFPQRIKNLNLTIYDKNPGVGGTWQPVIYPGVACDIPSDCTQWSAFYAPGSEIRAYLEGVVEKYKLMRYIKLQHELIHARYDEPTGKWDLKLRRPVPGSAPGNEQFEVIEDTADFVHAGIGILGRWKWPDIDGLKDFKGKIIHSASWDVDQCKDGTEYWIYYRHWADQLGARQGSSALQIVPAIQPVVKHLYNYVLGPTWLVPPFGPDKIAALIKHDFTEKDKELFKDPVFYREFRHEIESGLNVLFFLQYRSAYTYVRVQNFHPMTMKGSQMQGFARRVFKEDMLKRLEKKPWIADYLIPDFSVACKRLTSGPGYLKSVCMDNVDFVSTHIKRITETGIELVDGTCHELDVIICATGYDTSFQLPFTIIGRGGKNLNDRINPHPETHLTVCTDGFPNWFWSLGPNSGLGSGSLLVTIENQIEYYIAAAKKMQREHLKSIEAKKEAAAEFDEYLEVKTDLLAFTFNARLNLNFLGQPRLISRKQYTVRDAALGTKRGSWTVMSLVCGQNPRWEDFNYEQLGETKNRFFWLGDGSIYNEKKEYGAWYLDQKEVDIPPAKEFAYSPYSNFRVGAALLSTSGEIIKGANVENASYGGSICAERTAFVKAVSEGVRTFTALAVTTDMPTAISPCGMCRQVIREFCALDMPVLLVPSNYLYDSFDEPEKVPIKVRTVKELLPDSFGPEHLPKK
ncbi:hypothetical protein EW145_g2721 [Phellinidium pouzarii]|uniref:cytidine deaminase n=1 Tax=Phellinidium pouzarii TaxID=167371 RepID=A0A4V3XD54_9AGAM|nr:hypothetical protein EW145_g2721 [Phellinidium pouzarii]